jgi:hypothetical protein
MKRSLLLLAVVLLLLAGWLLLPGRDQRPRGAESAAAPAANASPVSAGGAAAAEAGASPLAEALNSPASDIRADLRIVSEIVDTFRTNFPRDGNPVGDNAEITAALTGRNKLRLALLPSRHPAINGAGELCDRWGTPFFFHAGSATKMEIRSAGPDKKMWTADDVVFSP